ncbi:MAG: hypothetical protein HC937_01150 [Aquincola sp.]|nr:hypothetical protein [Aquincola sp.]
MFATVVGLAPPIAAQRLSDAIIGYRVRLETTTGALVTGTVVALEPDTIRVASRDAQRLDEGLLRLRQALRL